MHVQDLNAAGVESSAHAQSPSATEHWAPASNHAFAHALAARREGARTPNPDIDDVDRALALSARARRIARAPAPAPGAPAQSAEAGVVAQAIAELRASQEVIDRNTAGQFDAGKLRWRFLEDLPVHPQSTALLQARTPPLSPDDYVVRVCPDGEPRYVAKNLAATSHHDATGAWVFVTKQADLARMRELLVHETNHMMRVDHRAEDEPASFNRYKSEFDAYWVSEYRNEPDLERRADKVKERVLHDYPLLGEQYDPNATGAETPKARFTAKVNNYRRPAGNVLNSESWRRIEQATSEAETLQALADMSREERTAGMRQGALWTLVSNKLQSDDARERALLMLGAIRPPHDQRPDASTSGPKAQPAGTEDHVVD